MRYKILDGFSKIDLFIKSEILQVVLLVFSLLILASTVFYIWGKGKPNANLTELKQRTNSWWIMISFATFAILIDKSIAFPAIGFLSFVAFRELYSIFTFRQSDRKAIFLALLSIPVQYYLASLGVFKNFIIFIPIVVFVLLPISLVLAGDTKGIIKSMASLQWSLMLTVFGLSHMAFFLSLPEISNFENGGQGLIVFLIFLSQVNDILQFIFGKLFGKHKITPNVSPNKTWEGFLGGLICTVIIGYFLRFLTPMSVLQTVIASLLIGVSGFFGDLILSAIKRDLGLKNTSTAIPGHGGYLDRIDSLLLSTPLFFHLIYYWFY